MPVALAPMADPFAMMQRIVADMDRQAAIMLQQVADLAARAPFDTAQPMMVGAGPGVCMQSVQITYTGHGAPHIVSHSSGACGPTAVPSAQPEAPVTTPAPRSIEVKATQPAPYASLVHRVSTLSP